VTHDSLLCFGDRPLDARFVHHERIATVTKRLLAPGVRALVIDARGAAALARAHELLRTLYDDPRRARRLLHPHRVIALVDDGDLEAAFELGRYGLAGLVPDRARDLLFVRVERIATRELETPLLTTPALAPPRTARLGPHLPSESPTIAIGHRHADETLDALARYRRVLHAAGRESSVFDDVAMLLDVMIDEGLTCQTNLACKAGVTHAGQFIGSFDYYRELRRTRYARIADHPEGLVSMEVFIAVDEVIHEVLHLLFLANELRAGARTEHTELAEELSVTWWQGVIHQRVWGDWLAAPAILEINDDFMLSEGNAQKRGFWSVKTVFERYAGYPWVPYVLARLPERIAYIGERADLDLLLGAYIGRSEARFVLDRPERVRVPGPFASHPRVPDAMRIPSRSIARGWELDLFAINAA